MDFSHYFTKRPKSTANLDPEKVVVHVEILFTFFPLAVAMSFVKAQMGTIFANANTTNRISRISNTTDSCKKFPLTINKSQINKKYSYMNPAKLEFS